MHYTVIPKLSALPFFSIMTPPTCHSQILSHTFTKCHALQQIFFNQKAWHFKQLITYFFLEQLFVRFQVWILEENIFYCLCSLHHSRLCCLWAFTPATRLSLLPSTQFSPTSPSGSISRKPTMRACSATSWMSCQHNTGTLLTVLWLVVIWFLL